MESTVLFIRNGFHVTDLMVSEYPSSSVRIETDHIEQVILKWRY